MTGDTMCRDHESNQTFLARACSELYTIWFNFVIKKIISISFLSLVRNFLWHTRKWPGGQAQFRAYLFGDCEVKPFLCFYDYKVASVLVKKFVLCLNKFTKSFVGHWVWQIVIYQLWRDQQFFFVSICGKYLPTYLNFLTRALFFFICRVA